jgi:hexosaminidase
MHFHRIGSLLLVVATVAPAQTSLKLIPIPREVRAGAERSLMHGVRIVRY